VRAVDDRDEVERAGAHDDLLQRQDEPGRGGDVADVHGARAFARVGNERRDDLARFAKRQWDRRADVARACAPAGPLPRQVAGAVLEVCREHLVVRAERERAGSEVDSGRGVLDEGEVVRGAADVSGEGSPRVVEERGQAAVEEVDGLALQLALPGLVALEDRPRAGAERAVVEEGDLGIEEELASELLRGGRGHGPSSTPSPTPTHPGIGEACRFTGDA